MDKTISLWCERGKHDWTREAKRGRRPHNCPIHSGEETTEKVDINTEEEISKINEKILYYIGEYDEMMDECQSHSDKKFWLHMEAVQNRIIALNRRKKYLAGLQV